MQQYNHRMNMSALLRLASIPKVAAYRYVLPVWQAPHLETPSLSAIGHSGVICGGPSTSSTCGSKV